MTGHPPRWLLLHLGQEVSSAARNTLVAWLKAALNHVDWRCHVVLAGGDRELVLAAARAAAEHVERRRFVTVRLQPCLADDEELEHELVALASRFQERAYHEQTEPGLELLPILTPACDTSAEELVAWVGRLRASLAEPRLVLEATATAALDSCGLAVTLGELRRDILSAGPSTAAGIIALLGAGLVVESAIERLGGDPADTLSPCWPHRVADQARGVLFPCIRAFVRGGPAVPLEHSSSGDLPELEPPAELCRSCYPESVLAAAPGLAASGRAHEATAAALRVAVALAGDDDHGAAARCAACAARLATGAAECAGALLLEGLCLQRGGDLEGAVERMRQGLATGVTAAERPRVLLNLASCLEQLGRGDEAAAVTAEAVQLQAP